MQQAEKRDVSWASGKIQLAVFAVLPLALLEQAFSPVVERNRTGFSAA